MPALEQNVNQGVSMTEESGYLSTADNQDPCGNAPAAGVNSSKRHRAGKTMQPVTAEIFGIAPSDHRQDRLTEGLCKLHDMLREACPQGAAIRFEFEGTLRVHIDVRTFEEIRQVELSLAAVSPGTFHSTTRKTVPQRSFFKRVTALVKA